MVVLWKFMTKRIFWRSFCYDFPGPWVRAQALTLCLSLWTAARQDPLSVGFFRQEYKRDLPFPPPGGFLNPGIKPMTPVSQADFLPWNHLRSLWKTQVLLQRGVLFFLDKSSKNCQGIKNYSQSLCRLMQGIRLFIKDTVYIRKSGKAEIFLAQDIWLKQKC